MARRKLMKSREQESGAIVVTSWYAVTIWSFHRFGVMAVMFAGTFVILEKFGLVIDGRVAFAGFAAITVIIVAVTSLTRLTIFKHRLMIRNGLVRSVVRRSEVAGFEWRWPAMLGSRSVIEVVTQSGKRHMIAASASMDDANAERLALVLEEWSAAGGVRFIVKSGKGLDRDLDLTVPILVFLGVNAILWNQDDLQVFLIASTTALISYGVVRRVRVRRGRTRE